MALLSGKVSFYLHWHDGSVENIYVSGTTKCFSSTPPHLFRKQFLKTTSSVSTGAISCLRFSLGNWFLAAASSAVLWLGSQQHVSINVKPIPLILMICLWEKFPGWWLLMKRKWLFIDELGNVIVLGEPNTPHFKLLFSWCYYVYVGVSKETLPKTINRKRFCLRFVSFLGGCSSESQCITEN